MLMLGALAAFMGVALSRGRDVADLASSVFGSFVAVTGDAHQAKVAQDIFRQQVRYERSIQIREDMRDVNKLMMESVQTHVIMGSIILGVCCNMCIEGYPPESAERTTIGLWLVFTTWSVTFTLIALWLALRFQMKMSSSARDRLLRRHRLMVPDDLVVGRMGGHNVVNQVANFHNYLLGAINTMSADEAKDGQQSILKTARRNNQLSVRVESCTGHELDVDPLKKGMYGWLHPEKEGWSHHTVIDVPFFLAGETLIRCPWQFYGERPMAFRVYGEATLYIAAQCPPLSLLGDGVQDGSASKHSLRKALWLDGQVPEWPADELPLAITGFHEDWQGQSGVGEFSRVEGFSMFVERHELPLYKLVLKTPVKDAYSSREPFTDVVIQWNFKVGCEALLIVARKGQVHCKEEDWPLAEFNAEVKDVMNLRRYSGLYLRYGTSCLILACCLLFVARLDYLYHLNYWWYEVLLTVIALLPSMVTIRIMPLEVWDAAAFSNMNVNHQTQDPNSVSLRDRKDWLPESSWKSSLPKGTSPKSASHSSGTAADINARSTAQLERSAEADAPTEEAARAALEAVQVYDQLQRQQADGEAAIMTEAALESDRTDRTASLYGPGHALRQRQLDRLEGQHHREELEPGTARSLPKNPRAVDMQHGDDDEDISPRMIHRDSLHIHADRVVGVAGTERSTGISAITDRSIGTVSTGRPSSDRSIGIASAGRPGRDRPSVGSSARLPGESRSLALPGVEPREPRSRQAENTSARSSSVPASFGGICSDIQYGLENCQVIANDPPQTLRRPRPRADIRSQATLGGPSPFSASSVSNRSTPGYPVAPPAAASVSAPGGTAASERAKSPAPSQDFGRVLGSGARDSGTPADAQHVPKRRRESCFSLPKTGRHLFVGTRILEMLISTSTVAVVMTSPSFLGSFRNDADAEDDSTTSATALQELRWLRWPVAWPPLFRPTALLLEEETGRPVLRAAAGPLLRTLRFGTAAWSVSGGPVLLPATAHGLGRWEGRLAVLSPEGLFRLPETPSLTSAAGSGQGHSPLELLAMQANLSAVQKLALPSRLGMTVSGALAEVSVDGEPPVAAVLLSEAGGSVQLCRASNTLVSGSQLQFISRLDPLGTSLGNSTALYVCPARVCADESVLWAAADASLVAVGLRSGKSLAKFHVPEGSVSLRGGIASSSQVVVAISGNSTHLVIVASSAGEEPAIFSTPHPRLT
eukprot:TRINITY_DN26516_c0_g2_i1.p1 TRINITY_DN26516_c0_g2~~TRINITY_DN26516_c0_g2_i1.p1  ORF type:complete len:1217 (-),score=157.64 TRINITY_DN26516_c0_g2_i1:89-3739(-)